ncbi:hypothetical protein ABT158_44155 [Nonomuraea sp. NPDC001636]|uniref:hypothetical protein n=1 Tax=Nonomuraea sp. NPDC001636 TaxID=3154391 RepID=UPI0033200E04
MPALLLTVLYGAALTVAAVVALVSGELGPLWGLTLFSAPAEGVTATGPNLFLLVLAGLSWSWGIWQILRGPPAGPPPPQNPDTLRLRLALYVSVATAFLLHLTASMWADTTVVDSAVTCVLVVLFMRVLGRARPYMRGAGLLGYGGFTVIGVLGLLGQPVPEGVELVCALAGLVWTALVLRAQGSDDRWGTATVAYGVAGLVTPLVLLLAALPFTGEEGAVEALGVVSSVLMMIWLARSAHDLAAPPHRPARPARPAPEATPEA